MRQNDHYAALLLLCVFLCLQPASPVLTLVSGESNDFESLINALSAQEFRALKAAMKRRAERDTGPVLTVKSAVPRSSADFSVGILEQPPSCSNHTSDEHFFTVDTPERPSRSGLGMSEGGLTLTAEVAALTEGYPVHVGDVVTAVNGLVVHPDWLYYSRGKHLKHVRVQEANTSCDLRRTSEGDQIKTWWPLCHTMTECAHKAQRLIAGLKLPIRLTIQRKVSKDPIQVGAMPIRLRALDSAFQVVDCFTFFNELDILELRLAELDNVVDFHVLVEATHTFTGQRKKLYYDEVKAEPRFAKYLHKIVHLVIRNGVHETAQLSSEQVWKREHFQRDQINRGLDRLKLKETDILLISDVDEIPDATTVEYAAKSGQFLYNHIP